MTAPYSFPGSAWERTSPRLRLAAALTAALIGTADAADELQRYSRTELHMGVEFPGRALTPAKPPSRRSTLESARSHCRPRRGPE